MLRKEDAFTHTGCHNWKNISKSLKSHQSTTQHMEAVTKLHLMATQPPVSAFLDTQAKESQLANNEMLVLVIRALRYLSRQNISLRGVTVKKVSNIVVKQDFIKYCNQQYVDIVM